MEHRQKLSESIYCLKKFCVYIPPLCEMVRKNTLHVDKIINWVVNNKLNITICYVAECNNTRDMFS